MYFPYVCNHLADLNSLSSVITTQCLDHHLPLRTCIQVFYYWVTSNCYLINERYPIVSYSEKVMYGTQIIVSILKDGIQIILSLLRNGIQIRISVLTGGANNNKFK